MSSVDTPFDKRNAENAKPQNALALLSPGLFNLQTAVAEVQSHERGSSELDEEMSAQLQHLGTQLATFQEQLLQLIGPGSLKRVALGSGPTLGSCSSEDLGPTASSDLSASLYPASSIGSRIASPRMWDPLGAPSTANIPHLCEMLLDTSPAVQAAAVGSLRSLTGVPGNCSALLEAGAAPALLKLLAVASSPDVQEAALETLWNMAASNDPNIQATLLDLGTVKAAVQFLASPDVQCHAACLLAALACSEYSSINPNNYAASTCSSHSTGSGMEHSRRDPALQQMAAAGAIPLLLALLSNSQQYQDPATSSPATETVHIAALQCLKALASAPANKVVLAAAGAPAVLVQLLKHSCSTAAAAEATLGAGTIIELAAVTLQQLCSESITHGDVIGAGGVEVLVQLMQCHEAGVQAAAAGAFSSLATATEVQTSSTAAAAIPHLLNLLSSETTSVAAVAAGALQQLARDDNNRQDIATAGGVSKLAAVLCRDDSSSMLDSADEDHHHNEDVDALSENVSLALQNLAVDPANCISAVKTPGLVEALAQLLQEESSAVVAAAAGCLANMCWDSAGCLAVTACDGVLQQLMQLLMNDDQGVVINAANLVAKLAWEPALCTDITEAGALEILIKLLDSSTNVPSLAEAAAAALQNLTYEDTIIRKASISGGLLPVLVKILQGRLSDEQSMMNSQVREQLVLLLLGVLYNLALEPSNGQVIAAAGAAEPLVRLLEYGSESVAAAAGRCVGKLAVDPAVRQAIAECRKRELEAASFDA